MRDCVKDLPTATLLPLTVYSCTPIGQVTSQTTMPTRIRSMIRASVRLPLSASGGIPASGSPGWGPPP